MTPEDEVEEPYPEVAAAPTGRTTSCIPTPSHKQELLRELQLAERLAAALEVRVVTRTISSTIHVRRKRIRSLSTRYM